MKICIYCSEEKNLEDFKRDKATKGGRGNICLVCAREKGKAFYHALPEEKKKIYNQAKQRAARRNQIWICEYLSNHPCVDCAEVDIELLDLDHLDATTKVRDICSMVRGGYSLKRIQEEVAKCEVVCANCHRKRTNRRGNNYRLRFVQGLLSA